MGASDSLNTGCFEPLDNMLGGINTQTLASTTPIAFDQATAQKALIRLTGVLLAHIVIGPDTGVLMQGFYYFENLTTGSFNVTFTNTGGSVVLPQGRRGVLWVDTTYGPRVMSSIGSAQTDVLPAGTVMPFYNTAVPTGWTAVAINDYNLKIVSSGSGGVTSGSVDYSTLFGRTATDAHTLTASEIPNGPGLTYSKPAVSAIAVGTGTNVGYSTSSFVETGLTNAGGNGHTHPIDMRVKTVALTLGTRN